MTGGTLTLGTSFRFNAKHLPALGLGANPVHLADGATQSLGYGTGSATVTLVVARTAGLGSGASETLNLFDGSLLDVFDKAANFRTLRGVALWVESGGSTSGLTIGAASSNAHPLFFGATTHTATVYPDGPAFTMGSPAGVAVTSTSCNVKLLNNASVQTRYSLVFIGSESVSGVPIGLALALTYP